MAQELEDARNSLKETVVDYKESLEKFRGKKRMILSALQELLDIDTIDYEILKETGIGKTVNSFRKDDGEVGETAKQLVAKWKSLTSETIKQKHCVENPVNGKEEKKSSNDDKYTKISEKSRTEVNQADPSTVIKHEKSHDVEEKKKELKHSSKYSKHTEKQRNPPDKIKQEKPDTKDSDKKHKDKHTKWEKEKNHHREKEKPDDIDSKRRSVKTKQLNSDTTSQKRSHELQTGDVCLSKKPKISTESDTDLVTKTSSPDRAHDEKHKSHKSSKKHKSDKSRDKDKKHKHKSRENGDKEEKDKTFEEIMVPVKYPNLVKKKKKVETLEQKIAKTVAETPLPSSYLDDLPELLTDYKPLPRSNYSSESSRTTSVPNVNFEFKDIKASSRSDAVYSGRRRGYTTMYSLQQLCLNVLGNHLDDLEYVGGVPYSILEPVLKKATPNQLFNIEHFNVDFTQDTDNLWKAHCTREFKNDKPQEFESWRELYLRLVEERENRFKMIQSRLVAKEQQKQSEVRKSQVAYAMSSQPKPPREVRRQQAKYGTGSGTIESTARAATMMKTENLLKSCRSSSSGSSSVKTLTIVPPLMKKAKKFMNKLHHR